MKTTRLAAVLGVSAGVGVAGSGQQQQQQQCRAGVCMRSRKRVCAALSSAPPAELGSTDIRTEARRRGINLVASLSHVILELSFESCFLISFLSITVGCLPYVIDI